MSNPTPPGDTTPPASTSVPATPPIGKPYPQCTSGMAYDASTMPGSVATFRTCSKDLSARASGSRPDVANTMLGTRIGGSSSIRKRVGVSSKIFPLGPGGQFGVCNCLHLDALERGPPRSAHLIPTATQNRRPLSCNPLDGT